MKPRRGLGSVLKLWFALLTFMAFFFSSTPAHAQVQIPLGGYNSVVWHPQGDVVALSNSMGIDIYTADFQFLHRIVLSDENTSIDTFSMAWSPDGQYLAAALTLYPFTVLDAPYVETLYMWDAATFTLVRAIKGANGRGQLLWNPDSTLIAATFSSDDGWDNIGIYRVSDGKRIAYLPIAPYFSVMFWSHSANTIVVAANNVSVWDGTTYQKIAVLTENVDTERSITFSPDGTQIALFTLDDRSKIEVWDINTLKRLHVLNTSSHVDDLDWGEKGIIGASWDQIHIWDVNTETLRSLLVPPTSIRRIRWSPDGSRFISFNHDNSMALWDTATGDILKVFNAADPIVTLTPSPSRP